MLLTKIKAENPLVHCMTNTVVTNFTANGLLALGASPVMAYAKEEVSEMAKIAGALLLNIGTLSSEQIESMIIAGKAANEVGIPVILDPVGAGATSFRTEMSLRILKEVDVTILRGNAGEVSSLVGIEVAVKGVDGMVGGDSVTIAKKAAEQFRCISVVTGEVDVVTDGETIYTNDQGHVWMTKVVGTGCLLGAVIGAFAAVHPENALRATIDAVTFYGIAGNRAFTQAKNAGIGSFQEAFLNELHLLTDPDINDKCDANRTIEGSEKNE